MGKFSLRQFGHGRRRTTGRGNSRKTSYAFEGRDDVAVLAPVAAEAGGSIAECDHRSAFHRNFLQLSWLKKRHPLAVRRKERREGSSRRGQISRLGLIEPPSDKPVL